MTAPQLPPGFDFTDPDVYAARLPTEELLELRRTAPIGGMVTLRVAGNETTRNSITQGMMAFVDNPEQWEGFQKQRPITAVDAIGDLVPDPASLAAPERLRSGWLNGIKHWQVDYTGGCPVTY